MEASERREELLTSIRRVVSSLPEACAQQIDLSALTAVGTADEDIAYLFRMQNALSELRHFEEITSENAYREHPLVQEAVAGVYSRIATARDETSLVISAEYLLNAKTGFRHPQLLEGFLGAEHIELSGDFAGYLARDPVEVGGIIEGVREDTTLELEAVFTQEGGEGEIQLTAQPSAEYVGLWHTHPLIGKPVSNPSPSPADFAPTSGLKINEYPHIIVREPESLLYVPTFFADITAPTLRTQFERFTNAEMRSELEAHAHACGYRSDRIRDVPQFEMARFPRGA